MSGALEVFLVVFVGTGMLAGMLAWVVLGKNGFGRWEVRLARLDSWLDNVRIRPATTAARAVIRLTGSRGNPGLRLWLAGLVVGTIAFVGVAGITLASRVGSLPEARARLEQIKKEADPFLAGLPEAAKERAAFKHVTERGDQHTEPRYAYVFHDDESVLIRKHLGAYDAALRRKIIDDPRTAEVVLVSLWDDEKGSGAWLWSSALLLLILWMFDSLAATLALLGLERLASRPPTAEVGAILLVSVLGTAAVWGCMFLTIAVYLSGIAWVPCSILFAAYATGGSISAVHSRLAERRPIVPGVVAVILAAGLLGIMLFLGVSHVASLPDADDLLVPAWIAGGSGVTLSLFTALLLLTVIGGALASTASLAVRAFHGWACVAGSTRVAAWIILCSGLVATAAAVAFREQTAPSPAGPGESTPAAPSQVGSE